MKIATSRALSCLCLFALTSPNLAMAAKIKQYVSGQDQAVIELDSPDEAKAGDILLATHNGKQCSLEVLKTNEKIAHIKTSDCSFRSELAIGQTLEKSLMDPEVKVVAVEPKIIESEKVEKPLPVPIEEPKSTTRTYNSFILGSLFNAKMTFDGTIRQGTASDTGTLEYTHASGLLIGFERSQFNPNRWNHGFTVDYASLELDTLTVTSGGASESASVSGKTNVLNLVYSGKYLWEKFYLPVGMGLGSVVHSGNILYLQGVSGLVTFWLGAGVHVSENFNLEFQSRATALTADTMTVGTTTLQTTMGTFSAVSLQGKFLF